MNRVVAIVLFPEFQIIDAAGPIGAFEVAERLSPGAYSLSIRAAEPGTVRSSASATMNADDLGSVGGIDTLIVVGGVGSREAMTDPRLLQFVRESATEVRRTASVCSGAYVLAAAGLLDGRRATTYWERANDFARRFPKVKLDADRIWIRDGEIWTSAGITAGIDLALAMIADDLGEDLARSVARHLVVYHRRPSGQSQFSALLELDVTPRFSGLLAWTRDNLAAALTVEVLADRMAMSPRNFARAFAREIGVTPAKAIERLRLEAAREQVEASPASLEVIAREAGFGDPERMRRAFLRAFGQPPQALRRLAREHY